MVDLSGNNITIISGARLLTHDGSTRIIRKKEKYKDLLKFGSIVVRDNVFIGANAIVLPGVTIGPNSMVGAGSVVTKDVPPDTVVAGNPAKPICTMYEYGEKALNNNPNFDRELYKQDKRKTLVNYYMNQNE